MNIYSGFPGSSLEAIMENCETLKLDFFPFLLNHAIYKSETDNEGMWLLSGSDKKIHAYRSNGQNINEQKIEDYFIEFEDTKDSIALNFGSKSFRDYKTRISFYGCETGYSMLAIVDAELNQIIQCFPEHFQSPVTVMQLFNIKNRTDDFLIPDCATINEKEQVCLLVGSALENAVVYMNVLKNNLKAGIILPNSSNEYQATVCSLIADIDFDSKNEILLGTNENYILHYVYENNKWVEEPQLDMRHSVYNMCYLDISGNGLKDLVVLSEKGLHILKHRTKNIIQLLKSRLKLMKQKATD